MVRSATALQGLHGAVELPELRKNSPPALVSAEALWLSAYVDSTSPVALLRCGRTPNACAGRTKPYAKAVVRLPHGPASTHRRAQCRCARIAQSH